MAYTISWNEAFPAGSNAANLLAEYIQQGKTMVRERLDDIFGTSGATGIQTADPYLPILLKLSGGPTSRIIPGATSFAIRDNANARDNLLVEDDGDVTVFKDLRVDSGVGYTDRVSNGSLAATVDIDLSTGNTQAGTLANATTIINLTNPRAGAFYTLELKQDATGSRTVTWDSDIKWASGTAPTLTITAGRTDLIGLYYNGTYFLGVLAGSNFDV